MASATTVAPLARYLASTDEKIRDKAIKQLAAFLSSDSPQHALSKSDLDQLWQGIFYCFWMSDKSIVQQTLANELAELLLTTSSTPVSLSFLRGFWETTVREWPGIDRLRMDKYYMLVRRFVNATFRLLSSTGWNNAACEYYNNILTDQGGPLCPSDPRVPTSLAYHLADIYLEELERALKGTPALPTPLFTLLKPFFVLAAKTQNKTTCQRIQSAVFETLFSSLSDRVYRDDESLNKHIERDFPTLISNSCFEKPFIEGRLEPAELKSKLLRALVEIVSSSGSRDFNRRRLYALCKQFEGAV